MRGTPSGTTAVTAGLSLGIALAVGLATATPAQAASRDWEKSAMYVPQAQALSKSQGDGVTIAVISTGVDDTHPALKGKVVQGPDLAEGSLKKGAKGWGVTGTSMAFDALKTAPKAKILSITASLEDEDANKHKDGGKYGDKASTAEAIAYAVDKGGADVIAMSVGEDYTDFGGSTLLSEERAAVAYAVSKGVPIIAASGDDGAPSGDNKVIYPGAHAGAIAVAATRPGGARAPFSAVHSHIDVAAPGVDIHTAIPGGTEMAEGTAQSAALVSGVVALMKAKNPELTPAEIRAILRGTAQHPSSGRDPLVGYGQVNAFKAVQAAAGPPKTLKEAAPYDGKANLGTPDGAERVTSLPWGFGLKAGIGVTGLLGVVLLGLGVLRLVRRPKSPQPAAATPGAMPPGGPGPMPPGGPGAMPPGPGGYPPPGPGPGPGAGPGPQGRPPYGGRQPSGGQPYGGPPAGPPQG